MSRPLPRFESRIAAEDARKIERICAEATDEAPTGAAGQTAAGDGRRLRGIPIHARGTSGAVFGTDPVRAMLAKERRRRL